MDERALGDLIDFARIEQESRDVEPWADVIAHLRASGALATESALWVTKLYNAYDDLASGWAVFERCPTPRHWTVRTERAADLARRQFIGRERRNLYGGRIVRHLDSYVATLGATTQEAWVRGAVGDDPLASFDALDALLRTVWGVGRLAAFEWAEFATKVLGLPVDTADARLWESSGPRRSLERIWGSVDRAGLTEVAGRTRDLLTDAGVALSWWDFETIICDFNVMRDGRYYPGQHLADLREQIEKMPEPDRSKVLAAFRSVVPEPWSRIAPGIDRAARLAYRDTGRICVPVIPGAP